MHILTSYIKNPKEGGSCHCSSHQLEMKNYFFYLNIFSKHIKSNILSNITHMIVQTSFKNNIKYFVVHEKTSKTLIFLGSQPFDSYEDHN